MVTMATERQLLLESYHTGKPMTCAKRTQKPQVPQPRARFSAFMHH